MRKILAFLMIGMMSVVLSGCAPVDSLGALYTNDDNVSEGRLLGTWQIAQPQSDDDKSSRWVFKKSGDVHFYELNITSVEEKGVVLAKARLVRLEGALFVDFEGDTDDERLSSGSGLMPFPVISTHMIGRIWIEKDSLRICFLDDDWVKEQIKSGTFALPYFDEGGTPILIAKTQELRRFAQEHAEDQEAFSDKWDLVPSK